MVGFDEAIARANAALANGADVAFVEAPQTMEEIAAVPKRVNGPCLLNVVRGGKTPDIDMADAEAMGYAIAIFPGLLFAAIIAACDQQLAELKKTNRHPKIAGGVPLARDLRPLRRQRLGRAAYGLSRSAEGGGVASLGAPASRRLLL